MATMITDECINCEACVIECPNEAISEGEDSYLIDPTLCTECVGFHDYEACQAVCPVECCVPDPSRVETEAELLWRARRLHTDKNFDEHYPSKYSVGWDPWQVGGGFPATLESEIARTVINHDE